MDYISKLPYELIDHILMQENISIEDVTYLGSTCKVLRRTIWKRRNNLLFRHLFFKRWPALKEVCEKNWQKRKANIRKELIKRLKFKTRFLKSFTTFIRQMENHFDLKRLANQMQYLNSILNNENEQSLYYFYFEDDLIKILADNRNKYDDMTQTYYAKKLLSYVKQSHLKKEWHRFINLPVEQQILEKISTMMAQWCQPDKRLFYSDISTILDSHVQEILRLLKEKYPTHSIFSTYPEQFSFWRENNINANHWDVIETRQIINIIRMFIYDTFRSINYLSLPKGPENFFINGVLENKIGTFVSLSLIFSCVARRLGVRCDLIPAEVPFLLWKENYDVGNAGTYYFINVPSDGAILKYDNDYLGAPIDPNIIIYNINAKQLAYCLSFLPTPLPRGSEMNMMKYFLMTFYYMTECHDIRKLSNVEKSLLLDDNRYVDLTDYWILIKENLDWKKNWEQAIFKKMLNRFEQHLQWLTCVTPKRRTRKIKYAIGMIVKIDLPFRYPFGVIVGWDEQFNESTANYLINSEEYSTDEEECEMQITMSGGNPLWPFYQILCGDNTMAYHDEGKITPVKMNKCIDHNEIGRYFKSFMQTHYIPNKFLEDRYPEDRPVRERLIAQF